MAVLYQAATVVNDIEGTQYVTASLVLPSVYMLIHKVRKGEIVCNWYDSVVQQQQTTPEFRAARANLRTALEDRFIKALPDHVFQQYSIATLLDPRLKSFRFLSQGQRDTAVEAFRAQWTQKWQPQHAERPQPKPAAQKKTGLSAKGRLRCCATKFFLNLTMNSTKKLMYVESFHNFKSYEDGHLCTISAGHRDAKRAVLPSPSANSDYKNNPEAAHCPTSNFRSPRVPLLHDR